MRSKCEFWVALLPKCLSDVHWFDFQTLPPDHFIASLMQLSMMTAAERYGEFVADFKTERSGLREPQVMRIGWLSAADEARLRGNKSQMGFVTKAFGLCNGENALVDLPWNEARCDRNNRGAGGWPDFQFASRLRPFPGDQVLAAAVVAGRPRNGRRVIRVKAESDVGRHGDSRR